MNLSQMFIRYRVILFLAVTHMVAVCSVHAQIGECISKSNVYCVVTQTGPSLAVVGDNGSVGYDLSFVDAISSCKSNQVKALRKIKAVKKAIKKKKNILKNRKKLKKAKADLGFWRELQAGIIDCQQKRPIYPTPTPSPTPTFETGYSVVPISKFYLLEGASVLAYDNQFLGIFSQNKYDTNSINNRYGTYGNQYNARSIFNSYGTYGSKFSLQSPWNPHSDTPPLIYLNGLFAAYLTQNQFLAPRVDPDDLLIWLGK